MLKVHSIFESISGEAGVFPQGTWCTFIRLQGCNLQCAWCDTVYAQNRSDLQIGTVMPVGGIVAKTKQHHVLITGGEPLLQDDLPFLITSLLGYGHEVQVETNGSRIPDRLRTLEKLHWVVDYKLPSSGMNAHMFDCATFLKVWKGYSFIVKIVVDPNSIDDLSQLVPIMQTMRENWYKRNFLISPLDADGESIPSIVKWIEDTDKTLLSQIVFSVQLHKLLDLP
jgi:7-carboxy-7-deazaguanine synthase